MYVGWRVGASFDAACSQPTKLLLSRWLASSCKKSIHDSHIHTYVPANNVVHFAPV